ncbi:hypothetical protein CEXT_456601 [Caerostris extrusa]|uniref:Uncharacterized protein n=1 Tax=Caerostris extrusa TaxID=172846 RepID=A0AAV4MQJ6_CAEEX|nr:hypothetical protein CEXT_456601 [Caerostris extrusa]
MAPSIYLFWQKDFLLHPNKMTQFRSPALVTSSRLLSPLRVICPGSFKTGFAGWETSEKEEPVGTLKLELIFRKFWNLFIHHTQKIPLLKIPLA